MYSTVGHRVVFAVALVGALCGCSSSSGPPAGTGSGGDSPVMGGASDSGGTSGSGGTKATGGTAASGGAEQTGGRMATGGTSAPDAATASDGRAGAGGAASGAATGGRSAAAGTGGAGTGGRSGGDAAAGAGGRSVTGGRANSGGTTGTGGVTGTGGTTSVSTASYYLGADVSWAEAASDAAQDNLLSQLKQHGFNAIRLRTFVDPKAADGYDKTAGTCDLAHTIAFGKKVRDLGMALLVDFHYSDNWADPSKQCVPVAWQSKGTIDELATAVYDYTKDAITKLIAGGARPVMVQIGNETTPGMLMHVCDGNGEPTGSNRVSGSSSNSNWPNLGKLFKAGIKGVKDVDPTILTALHIDRCGDKPTESPGSALSTSKWYVDSALQQGVAFDVLGESCYQQYQGDPNSTSVTKTGWTNTLTSLASAYPNLKLMAAEYGPMQREINDVVFGLANRQGIGTFNWEPDRAGFWNTGHELFTLSGNTYTPRPDLALYDDMKTAYASRL